MPDGKNGDMASQGVRRSLRGGSMVMDGWPGRAELLPQIRQRGCRDRLGRLEGRFLCLDHGHGPRQQQAEGERMGGEAGASRHGHIVEAGLAGQYVNCVRNGGLFG